MPTFQMVFSGTAEEAFSLLHEKNKLEVSFGQTPDDMVTTQLSIQNKSIVRQGETKRLISINGTYAALSYLQSPKVFLSAKKSAIEVMLEKAKSNGLSIHKESLKKSNDSQIWIQPNITDKRFVTEELWMHADLGTGIPAVGISSQGDFIVKDLKAEGGKEPAWRFTYNASKKNEIIYDGDYVTSDQTGFINSWVGYGKEKIVYDLEEGEQVKVLNKPKPIVAMTSNLAKSDEVQKKFSRVAMLSDDMHHNYWAAYNYNLANLASLSSIKITLSFHGKYIPIKVLDQVFFADDDVRTPTKAATTFNTGKYFVTKVSRSLGSRQLTTVVELCRESFNEIK